MTVQSTVVTPGSYGRETEGIAATPPSVCLGTDTLTNAEVRWPLTTKGNPHLLIAGLPGMGKTTCLLNLCRQMVAADIRPIVFSYHQDIDERLEQSVDSVRFIDFDGLGFNPLEVVDRESRMAHLDVAGAIRDIFTAVYPELGDIQADRIRRAVKDSFIEAGWGDPDVAPSGLREPPFKRFIEILRSEPKPDRGLRTLLARLEELADYRFFELDESHRSLWESDRPTVIRIHTTRNDNLQRAFASLVFYGLYKDMFRRGIQERIYACPDLRRGTSCRRPHAHSHHGKGVPKVRYFLGACLAGGTGFPRLRVLRHRELSGPPSDRDGCEITRAERRRLAAGADADRQDQADGQIQGAVFPRRHQPAVSRRSLFVSWRWILRLVFDTPVGVTPSLENGIPRHIAAGTIHGTAQGARRDGGCPKSWTSAFAGTIVRTAYA